MGRLSDFPPRHCPNNRKSSREIQSRYKRGKARHCPGTEVCSVKERGSNQLSPATEATTSPSSQVSGGKSLKGAARRKKIKKDPRNNWNRRAVCAAAPSPLAGNAERSPGRRPQSRRTPRGGSAGQQPGGQALRSPPTCAVTLPWPCRPSPGQEGSSSSDCTFNPPLTGSCLLLMLYKYLLLHAL